MPAHPDQQTQFTGEIVGQHMDRILQCFKDGAKIAVIVWRDDLPDQDFIMASGELDEVVAAIERRKTDPRTLTGDV